MVKAQQPPDRTKPVPRFGGSGVVTRYVSDPVHTRVKYVSTWINPTDKTAIFVEDRFEHCTPSFSRLGNVKISACISCLEMGAAKPREEPGQLHAVVRFIPCTRRSHRTDLGFSCGSQEPPDRMGLGLGRGRVPLLSEDQRRRSRERSQESPGNRKWPR